MKKKILDKTIDLFLTLGVKSVTMDDIARELAISKKTIYTYFPNKRKLVEAATIHAFNRINEGIQNICKTTDDAIEEMFLVKDLVLKQLKNEKSSPQFQLQKYYPKIFENLRKKQLRSVETCISKNLQKGIEQGYYRKEIDVELTTKLYFTGIIGIKNVDVFPSDVYSVVYLSESFLEYHIRAIATEKGIEQLLKLQNK